jgi:hypothetical protein
MSVCVVIQSEGVGGGGSDVTPDAINFNNIVAFASFGTTNTVTISGIDAPITLRATWTASGTPILGYWYVNGALVSIGTSPRDVTVTNGATVYFRAYMTDEGASTGTVTVTNQSDGGATLDTFTFYIEYTFYYGGGGGGGDPIP